MKERSLEGNERQVAFPRLQVMEVEVGSHWLQVMVEVASHWLAAVAR